MLLYGILFLLFLNTSLSHSACCEEEIRTKFLLDTTSDLISKMKSTIPTCEVANDSLGHKDCCEEEMRNKSLLDTMRDLISKAKSSVPTCSVKEECTKEYLDCADFYLGGYNKSGLYTITPVNRLFYRKHLQVYCDMETDGGGWTVIQRRGNFGSPDDYFFKDWKSYKDGFGNLEKDFWIGNDNIFSLTNQKAYSIRFDFEKVDKNRTFANYNSFWIDNEYNNYMLHISGYNGTAGDGMAYHDAQPFSTKDKPNNAKKNNDYCATLSKGAWWYVGCYYANLNGVYNTDSYSGIHWYASAKLKNTMVWTEMKIRPAHFSQASQLKHS